MLGALGIIIIFSMVFGGYILAGGKLGIILKALPYEMMMIGGAAIGAFLLANDKHVVHHTAKDISKVFKGPKWVEQDHQDLLCLLFQLLLISRKSPVELEAHIDQPDSSDVFNKYPKISLDRTAIDIICDTLRSASMNYDDPNQVEEVLDKRIEEMAQSSLHTSHAMQTLADGLPALGILAAVLGVIKTMGSIDQPPEVLGKLIGGALVGTFLGVFLAYCIAAPFANKLKSAAEEDLHFYRIIRDVLIANLQNHPANMCIEVGRQTAPPTNRPNFSSLENVIKDLRKA